MSASSSEATKRTSAGGGPDWSDIADDVLINIIGRLNTLHDVVASRAVCRSWRKVAIDTKHSTISPLLVIRTRDDVSPALFDVTHRGIYSLRFPWNSANRKIIAYSHPHLITDTTRRDEASIHLWDIFTGAQTILPPTRSFFDRIRFSPTGQILLLEHGLNYLQYINVGDATWTVAKSSMLNTVLNMMFFQGEWLALTEHMELLIVELRGQSLIVRESWGGRVDDISKWGFYSSWLGEFEGVLFAVHMYTFHYYAVFQWDSGKKGWEETRDVGDKAFLLSSRGSLVLISATRLGLRKNCLYTTNHTLGLWDEFLLEDRSRVEVNIDRPHVLPVQVQYHYPIWVFPNNR